MRILIALVAGYLLGSVLPADLFARARGVDIRTVGTHNPGATNVLQQLGVWPGLITGAYDCSVGLAAMAIASWLGLAQAWVYLAGLSAVIGHVFPIFFRFRGGQGMAATTGMLVYGIGVALSQRLLTPVGMLILGVVAIAGLRAHAKRERRRRGGGPAARRRASSLEAGLAVRHVHVRACHLDMGGSVWVGP